MKVKLFKKIISIVLSFNLLIGQGVPYVLAQEATPEPTPLETTQPSATPDASATNNDTGNSSDNTASATTTDQNTVTNDNNANVDNNLDIDTNSGQNVVGETPSPTPELISEESVLPSDSPSPTPLPCPSGYKQADVVDPLATPASSDSTAVSSDSTTVAVNNSNCVVIGDTTSADAVSGQNNNSNNDGDATTNTGDVAAAGSVDNTANSNTTDVSTDSSLASAGNGAAVVDSGTSQASNTATGEGSSNFALSQSSESVDVQNDNAATLNENLDVSGNSGANSSSNNDGDVSVTTGDVELTARLINILNLNITGEDFIHLIINIYGDISGDFDLSAFAQAMGISEGDLLAVANNTQTTEGSVNSASASASDQLNIGNNNGAQVENNMNVSGNSGTDIANNNDGDVSIITGRVKILVSLLNFINSNFSGTNWYFAMINIFSNVNGDINLPDAEKYLYAYIPAVNAQASNSNTGENSTNLATASASSITTIDNNNDANLDNNINVNGDSGNNQSLNNDGKTQLETGTVEAVVSLINWVNTNLTGNNWVVLVVNVLGKWVGNLIAFPGMALFTPASGSGVYAFLARGQARIAGETGAIAQNTNTGEGSINTTNASVSDEVSVANNNSAAVINNVNVDGVSGQNQANGNDGNVRMVTGDVSILAGILNIINTNVTGRNWMLIFINIFGSLSGDLVFPTPDLAISINDGTDQVIPGSTLNYQVTVTNLKNGMARNVRVTADIPGGDASTLLAASDGGYQGSPQVHWQLGDLNPGESRTLAYSVAVDPAIKNGTLTAMAVTATDTQEPNLNNNSSSDTTNVSEPGTGGNSGGSNDQGSSNNSSGSSSSSSSSSSDSAGSGTGPQVLGLSATSGISDSFLFDSSENLPAKQFDYSDIIAVILIMAGAWRLSSMTARKEWLYEK